MYIALFQMNQVSNWLDLSQIYNSKRAYFDSVNRANDTAKLFLDSADGGKGLMPRCPLGPRYFFEGHAIIMMTAKILISLLL